MQQSGNCGNGPQPDIHEPREVKTTVIQCPCGKHPRNPEPIPQKTRRASR